MKTLLVAGTVAALIGGQGQPAAASGHAPPAESAHGAPAPTEPRARTDGTKSGTQGIDLGDYHVRAYHVSESQKSTASFALYATVEKDKLEESKHLLESHKHRLRNQVILVTRLVPLKDFDDPNLSGFRRRILLQLRRTLPELAIEQVYVSDFVLQVDRI